MRYKFKSKECRHFEEAGTLTKKVETFVSVCVFDFSINRAVFQDGGSIK